MAVAVTITVVAIAVIITVMAGADVIVCYGYLLSIKTKVLNRLVVLSSTVNDLGGAGGGHCAKI